MIYVTVVIGPLLLSSIRDVRIFGVLAALVLAVTFMFFAYAYASLFCFGGALMSAYLVWMIFRGRERPGMAENLADGESQDSNIAYKASV